MQISSTDCEKRKTLLKNAKKSQISSKVISNFFKESQEKFLPKDCSKNANFSRRVTGKCEFCQTIIKKTANFVKGL